MAYSLEELMSLGAKPVQTIKNPGTSYTLEELQGMGARPTLDQAQSGLAHSQAEIDKLQLQAQQAEAAAKQAQSPKGIVTETAKGTAGGILDTAGKFVRSALEAPADIFNMMRGKGPDISATTGISGVPQQTIQGEYASGKTGLGGALLETGAGALDVIGMKGGAGALEKPVSKVAGLFSDYATKRAEKKALSYASELTAPKTTTKTSVEAIQQGRFSAPGFKKAGKVLPTAHDNQVAESVSDVVSKKNSLNENVDAIQQRLAETNAGVREMIATRKTPFNMNQLRSRLAANKEESKLVFASDATAERTYDAVMDEFMKHVGKGDTLGLFEARQTFDRIPAIKKLLDSEALGENVRRQIVLDVRKSANEYIAEQLPANNPYRSAIMRESRMIEALGNIAEKNSKIIGKNRLQLLTEEYPIIKWLAGGLVGASGVGVGAAIIGSTD